MLLRRVKRSAAETIEHLVGMQSQLPPGPFIGLWSRLHNFEPAKLDEMMLERRAVRMTLMRGTLHLVTARDAYALRPVMQPVVERIFASTAFRRNLEGLDLREVVAAGEALLTERPRTGSEVARALAERWPDHDATSLGYAVRFFVPTVQVTPRGIWGQTMRPTLTTLEAWLGEPVPAEADAESAVLRYLAAFGPASPADVRTWSWMTGVREIIERLRARLRSFRDEAGRELFDLPGAPIVEGDVPAPPRFLPVYDNVFLSHEDRSRIHGGRWYPTVEFDRGSLLVDGFVKGGWMIQTERRAARLQVDLFFEISPSELSAVEEEADALLAFAAADAETRNVEVRKA